MSEPTSPFVIKTASEIMGELLEHITAGIVTIDHEKHTYASGTDTYTLTCGSPDVDGDLVEVNRLWGVQSGNFKEFREGTEFDVDLANNQITFTAGPDDATDFYVSYRYDQKFTSGITDVSDGSVISIFSASFSRNLAATYRSLDLIKAAAYIDSALGDDLDQVVKLVGTTRNAATVATGFVTFYRDSESGDAQVPSGTQIAADAPDGVIVYETTSAVWFRDGFTSVRAPVQASSLYEGTQSNMAPDKIVRLIGSAGGASRVNNPSFYSDYEFKDLVDGLYTYQLDYPPRRVINTKGFVGGDPPWDVDDKGVIGIWNFRDLSMLTVNWATSNVTLTQDSPESGQLKCEPTAVGGYISRTFASEMTTYDHAWLMVRGTPNDEFNVLINGATATMYAFQETSGTTSVLAKANWTLYIGEHGASETGGDTSTFRIDFQSTNTFWIDFTGIGMELDEVHGVAMTSEDQVKVNYTAKNFGFWFSSETQNFYQKWDGNSSDGVVDYCFIYYQWNNHVSGGADEESDSLLRDRGRNALDVAARGTKDAIKNAVLDIDGVTQCEVTDYNDDTTIDPGVCQVAVLAGGFTISPALNQEIVAVVEEYRAAGVYAQVFAPQVRYVNFELNVVYDDGIVDYVGAAGQSTLTALINSVIDDYFSNIGINDAAYFSDLIGEIIEGVRGVAAAYVTWDDSTEPTISDDDFGGTYAYDSVIVLDDPRRITGQKVGATIVVQRGNNATLVLLRMSENK